MAVEEQETFGSWLKRARKRRRLTQQALGQLGSYSADHIRKVEADERRFGEAQARLLAEIFTIPAKDTEAFVAWARGGAPPADFPFTTPLSATDAPTLAVAAHTGPPSSTAVPASGSSPTMSTPLLPRSATYLIFRRFWGRWLCGGLVLSILMLGAVMIAYQRGQVAARGQIVPGGLWLSPDPHFVTHGDIVQFAARAYPTHAGDPAIASVNFTVFWPGAHGDWQVACHATTPVAGTTDMYHCAWNRALAQAPDGPIRVSFDAYDAKGHVNLAPNGIHEDTLQQ